MARYAYADGATHFVSLHLDSFPIDAGWLDSAAAAVADGAPFSCIQPKCYNAFMFWDRAWQETGVGMLPTAADRAGTAFARFIIEHPTLNHADGGLGFLFNAWQAGRQWHSVEQTSPTIWGNRLMHLEGATRIAMSKQLPSILTRVKTPISLLLPDKLRKYLSLLVWRFFAKPVEQPAGGPTLSSKQEQISAVVADPEGFIARCRATQLSTDYGVSAVE
jgi:hypothetical protein